MKKRGVNRGIQMKIRRYIGYMHNEEKTGLNRGQYLLENLSSDLRVFNFDH